MRNKKGLYIAFDVDDGRIIEIGGLPAQVLDFMQKENIKPEKPTKTGNIAEGTLSLTGIKEVGSMIFSHSSPGCYTIFSCGQYYQI